MSTDISHSHQDFDAGKWREPESYIDLDKLEKREHAWVQRGRFLGCHCHPHTGSMLPRGVNLTGVENGEPVFSKG